MEDPIGYLDEIRSQLTFAAENMNNGARGVVTSALRSSGRSQQVVAELCSEWFHTPENEQDPVSGSYGGRFLSRPKHAWPKPPKAGPDPGHAAVHDEVIRLL